ncbi:tetratricopeptide repeat protein [Streptomyces sp. NPDC006372]|uniref:tetratricopeptide repeat protein n=1 Tax=Streptomyces sp. NPDC006372 TaxID=3155599 RepID=UPI0033ACBC62
MSGTGAWRRRGQWVSDSVVYGSVVQVTNVTGDVSVHAPSGERPLYRVHDFPRARPTISVKRARNQPARLLQDRYTVVDFIGRHTELQDLAAWRDSSDPVSVLLLHGSGGQGKTRLAAQVAQASRDLGWQALQARHSSDPDVGPAQSPGGADEPANRAGVLMLVDYAERWPTSDLLELCADATRQAGRARVLLIARPAGVWWQTLSNDLDHMDIETAELALHALADDPDISPAELFATARDRFADVLDIPRVGELEPPPEAAENPEFRQVLAVHMAALATVDAYYRRRQGEEGVTRPALGTPAEASAYLLTRERSYWEKLHANGRVHVTADALGQVAYTAALTGAQPYADGLEAVTRVSIASTEPGDRILKDHAVPYPPPATIGDVATVLEPLYPDRLAEDFLALSVPGHTVRGYAPDPWSVDVPRRLLALLSPASPDAATSAWPRTALTALISAANRWPHVATRQLVPLLTKHPQLAVQAGGAALAELADLPGLDVQVLKAIEPHLPEGRHTDLDPGSAVVAYHLAKHRLTHTQAPLEHASVRDRLASRLHYAGLHQEAVATALDALRNWRYLAAANPRAHEPDLAMALHNLGAYLSKVGQREEALAATLEAVTILQRLVAVDSDTYEPPLASSLTNLGAHLAETGQQEEALTRTREAVDLYQRLITANPAVYAPEVISALANLGALQSKLGQLEEALVPAREAVTICRQLAEANPAAYEPDLAMTLNHLGGSLSRINRLEEALSPTQESADIYRRLAEANPTAYEPDLAMTLTNVAICLSQIGQQEEALAPAREALAIRRQLAEASPAAHEPKLATALSNLAGCLAGMELWEDALASAQEAADLYRQLVEASPEVYNPDFAMALRNLSGILWRARGKAGLPAALESAVESVEIFRGLARAMPHPYAGHLREAILAQADVLDALDRTEEATATRDLLLLAPEFVSGGQPSYRHRRPDKD